MILGGISMITMLAKIFIKNRPAKEQRQAYGTLCSIVGICLNVCLFAGKYFAGMLSGSVAITADAFNNLSDAGSSFITLAGFLYAGKTPDSEHPSAILERVFRSRISSMQIRNFTAGNVMGL